MAAGLYSRATEDRRMKPLGHAAAPIRDRAMRHLVGLAVSNDDRVVEVVFVLALAVVALLPWLVPLPTVVSVVGIALIVPFFSVHCAEPALRAVGAPRRTMRLVRASVVLCMLAASLYATLTLVWAVTGTLLISGAGFPLRLASAVFAVPVILGFLVPTLVISGTPHLPRRGVSD